MKNALAITLAATLFVPMFLTPTSPAEACMGCPCGGIYPLCIPCFPFPLPSVEGGFEAVKVSFPDSDRALIEISGYITTHFLREAECITSMPTIPGIEGVDSVVNFDSRTKLPFAEITFAASDAASSIIPKLMTFEYGLDFNGPWTSFVSTITGDVEDGIPNHFLVEVTLEDGVTPYDFIRNLREEGVFLTASSENGIPNGEHIFVKPFSDFEFIVTFPGRDPADAGE